MADNQYGPGQDAGADKPTKKHFINPIVLSIALGLVIIQAVAAFVFNGDLAASPHRAGEVVGTAMGGLCWPLILAGLARLISMLSPANSQRIATTVFTVVFIPFFIYSSIQLLIKNPAGPDPKVAMNIAQAESQRLAKDIEALTAEYNKELDGFANRGGLDVSMSPTLDDLQERQKSVRAAIAVWKKKIEVTESMDDVIAGKLRERGYDEKFITDFYNGFHEGSRWEMTSEVMQIELTVANTIDQTLTILIDHYGEWEWSRQDGMIMFQEDFPDELIDQMNANIDRINSLSQQQMQMQQQLMKEYQQ